MGTKKKELDKSGYLKSIPEEDKNPNHKEDFESLLAAAIGQAIEKKPTKSKRKV